MLEVNTTKYCRRLFMSVEVIAVGGYEEVGRNMTAVKVESVIIFDRYSP